MTRVNYRPSATFIGSSEIYFSVRECFDLMRRKRCGNLERLQNYVVFLLEFLIRESFLNSNKSSFSYTVFERLLIRLIVSLEFSSPNQSPSHENFDIGVDLFREWTILPHKELMICHLFAEDAAQHICKID